MSIIMKHIFEGILGKKENPEKTIKHIVELNERYLKAKFPDQRKAYGLRVGLCNISSCYTKYLVENDLKESEFEKSEVFFLPDVLGKMVGIKRGFNHYFELQEI